MNKMAKIETKIFDELKKALSSFDGKYLVGEELNRSKLTDDLRNYDEALLSKLFEVEFIKQHFIKEVAGQPRRGVRFSVQRWCAYCFHDKGR